MIYAIVDNEMEAVAEFTDERHRDECWIYVFDKFHKGEYARVKIDDSKPRKKQKKRTNGEIIQSINNLLGFTEYKDKIKWSNANKEEMLRLEKAIRKTKQRGTKQ